MLQATAEGRTVNAPVVDILFSDSVRRACCHRAPARSCLRRAGDEDGDEDDEDEPSTSSGQETSLR